MQYILQNTKRLISICLVTLLLVTSSLLSFPTPARAEGNTVFCNGLVSVCPPVDININLPAEGGAFTVGAALGAVTGSAAAVGLVSATGSVVGLSAAGITSGLAAIGSLAGGGMLAGVAVTAAAPATAAVAFGYGTYVLWEKLSH